MSVLILVVSIHVAELVHLVLEAACRAPAVLEDLDERRDILPLVCTCDNARFRSSVVCKLLYHTRSWHGHAWSTLNQCCLRSRPEECACERIVHDSKVLSRNVISTSCVDP